MQQGGAFTEHGNKHDLMNNDTFTEKRTYAMTKKTNLVYTMNPSSQLKILKSLRKTIAFSFREFNLLITGSEYFFSYSGFWFSDFDLVTLGDSFPNSRGKKLQQLPKNNQTSL